MTVGKRPYAAKDPFELVNAFKQLRPRVDQDRPDVPRALAEDRNRAADGSRREVSDGRSRPRLAERRHARGDGGCQYRGSDNSSRASPSPSRSRWSACSLRCADRRIPRRPTPPVIAVLPLENLSGDASKQCRAWASPIPAMALSKVRQLTVISRSETQTALREADDPKSGQSARRLVPRQRSVQRGGRSAPRRRRIVRPDGGVKWSEA